MEEPSRGLGNGDHCLGALRTKHSLSSLHDSQYLLPPSSPKKVLRKDLALFRIMAPQKRTCPGPVPGTWDYVILCGKGRLKFQMSKLIQTVGRIVWRFFKKKKIGIKPPYDPAIPLLGIYPEETKIEKDTCNPMFIAALFTIVRTWKQPRYPLTDEWIKQLWYTHNGILLSHKKERIWVSHNEVDEPRAYYTEWS